MPKRSSRAAFTTPSASTTAVAPSPTAPSTIDWPTGGFQWTHGLRSALPFVRGIRVPEPIDGRALLAHLPTLSDVIDEFIGVRDMFAGLAQHLVRPSWKPWGHAQSKKAITRKQLEQPDREYWLELLVQTMWGFSDHLQQRGVAPSGGAFSWAIDTGIALHGLRFVVEPALVIARALEHVARPRSTRATLFEHLRAAIASADDEAHDAAMTVFEAHAGATAFDRLLRAHLCPHREEWVLQALADDLPDDDVLLAGCVMPPAKALAYLKARATAHMAHLKQPMLLQIHLHGEGAIGLMAHALENSPEKRSTAELLALAQRMHAPRMLELLGRHLEDAAVRSTLDKFAQRWPAAVLKTVIERAQSAPRSRVADDFAVGLALREPVALDAVMPALEEDARAHLSNLLGQSQRKDAAADQLPPVLRAPPWLGKARAAELPTLALVPTTQPDKLRWPPGEEARYAAHRPSLYVLHGLHGTKRTERALELLQIAPSAWKRVLAGQPLQPGDVGPAGRGVPVDLVFGLPDDVGIAVWNSHPPQNWNRYGYTRPELMAVLAKWGPAAIPGFARWVQTYVQEGLEAAHVVDSPQVAPTALLALRTLRKAKAHAIEWLRAHAATACSAAIPMAFGTNKAAREDAAHGLRWFVQNGFESTARNAAASYGPEAVAAFQALLDADPLLVRPSRIPKLPSFFVAASLRRPELRSSGAALPVAAVEHIGTMLAISKLEAPYAGVQLVREACTPSSLADFAWDLFEAWTAADAPSRENWAFTALGLLGNDETARRLAPRIREWPGQSQHQRAVAGLDVLAAIGSDVALMHLNGIATRSTHKPLQRHAQEKIAAVAEARGLTAAELADRLVPDLGLDQRGTLALDFGPRRFFVGFDESLKPFVKDAQGARSKDLPKPVKSDDAALAGAATERWKQMKKDAKAVASLEVIRLEMCMVERRRWAAKDFRLFFVEHPLMRHLAARLLWGVYGDDGALKSAFRVAEDWTLADAEDNATTLSDDSSVGIAHVREMPKPLLDAFSQVFADYKILQPLEQLGRETYALTDAERKTSRITRYERKLVATGSVMSLANRGWRRGHAESGWVNHFSKPVGDQLEVKLELDPGTFVEDTSANPTQTLPGITLCKVGTWDQDEPVNFEQLHPIFASEVLRDIELMAPYKEA